MDGNRRALEAYLRSLDEDRGSGEAVTETSGYGALQNMLNAAGTGIQPRVRAVINIRNRGAGIPDGGLFTADQFERGAPKGARQAQLPARGAVEVKGVAEDVREVSRSEQVGRYLERYGQVLVTNYREFMLVSAGPGGAPVEVEGYSIAENVEGFWEAAALAGATAEAQGERFGEFLRRAMLHGAPLSRPADLASLLASHARDAMMLLDAAPAERLSSVVQVRASLEESLGISFEGERGEHFFRSTLVQTLFYGVFSAWVLWHRRTPLTSVERFDWRLAAYILKVPMIQALFEQLAMPSRVEALGLSEVLGRVGEVLSRVDRSAFFEEFDEEGAVQYFYEPFLEAFDPELRRQLGVWYTPPEVVRYMVEKTDRALREDLGVEDGLAGEEVYVLDPCTGTGSYLVEVLNRVRRTLSERGEDALAGAELKRVATERVFGFELLPAPFVVAHLQVGLMLERLGAPLSGAERAGVYLTNALTGWKPADETKRRLPLPEFEEEREAAEEVKRRKPVLVVIGNPPYNGYAGVGMEEERDLSDAYRNTKAVGLPAPHGQGLNDLYVRFFRMAERRIVEGSGRGIVCYVSNYSWLDGLSFTGMRERYLEAFDRVAIDSLNGDRYRTGKVDPDGRPDPSVFSTPSNREGIQVGTAVTLLVREEDHHGVSAVAFRDLWGPKKREQLLEEAEADTDPAYEEVAPVLGLGLPFRPLSVEASYLSWPLLPELFPVSYPGVKTSRDGLVVDVDRERLVKRMERYFDPGISDEEMSRISPAAMRSTSGFGAPMVRRKLQQRGLLRENFVRYCYRPFDLRWLYWEPEAKLLDRSRPEYFAQIFEGNAWIEARGKQPKDTFDRGYASSVLADNFGNGLSNWFPLYLREAGEAGSLFGDEVAGEPRPNLSEAARSYLMTVEAPPEDLFHHVLATLHSPSYRVENAGALRQDWPRVALPADADLLSRSASLGREVAELLDPSRPVRGVTTGGVRQELRSMAVVRRTGGGPLDPSVGDLAVTAGWGYTSGTGATMAGRGRAVLREYVPQELAAVAHGAETLSRDPTSVTEILGEETYDVYLNETAYLANVPSGVWEYTAGGYQVLKKWLSYRELEVLGRPLGTGDVREFAAIARRIAALLLMGEALDESYRAIRDASGE